MVVLILYEEKNIYGQMETLVSHGVDTITLRNVALPSVRPSEIGYYSEAFGEWILNEDEDDMGED